MQIVIDIPEDVLKRTVFYREFRELSDYVTTIKALEKAVPLPEGHGRLIDADALVEKYERDKGRQIYADNFIFDLEMNAPTIIEADKEE